MSCAALLTAQLFRETDACNMSVAPDAQVKHDLVLHLQTGFGQKGAQVDQEIVRAAELVPSLKLPNIEVEYILTVTVRQTARAALRSAVLTDGSGQGAGSHVYPPCSCAVRRCLCDVGLTICRLLAGDSALVHELTADERAAPAPAYTA